VNVVPEHAVARWSARSPTLAQLELLVPRVLACLQAGADAAGCGMEVVELFRAEDVRTNPVLIDLYIANMTSLGRPVHDPAMVGGVVGSTDMGRISYLLPSIHPMIKIAPGVAIHDPVFAEHACSPAADAAVLDGAKAMAMTVVDLWTDARALPAAHAAFRAQAGIQESG
jgi:metal-dependent amidase/aminoacylase/carboxypeptidase family protein